jgi:predicted dehydrogenase/threonine dehydrogenase-like Zn-dependent dehydrogenase
MKQVVQHVSTGKTEIIEVPTPSPGSGSLLVQTAASLISAGTERMLVEFSDKSLLAKARSRPDLVKQTLDKAQREGILAATKAVRNRLDQPMALGYSSAGVVLEVGADVTGFHAGDRVACGGGGHAVHAEAVVVPQNLAVKLPEDLDFEAAAFTTVGAIALQGIRLAGQELGESVGVIGLGLLGQLTVQMLKAAGCRVIGLDIQPARAELASRLRSAGGAPVGADAAANDPQAFTLLCQQMSGGRGLDAVLITADTPSSQPVALAGAVSRKKGVVVAVGAVGMNIPRKVYYEKELTFRVSSSYGPGRYDPNYEEKGQDYPYAYVRWTEKRNMEAFVQLMAQDRVNVRPLITHRFPLEEAPKAYELISGKQAEPFLGVLLTYPEHLDLRRRVTVLEGVPAPSPSLAQVALGVLGAGNYATATLLPALRGIPGLELVGIASQRGLTARSAADRFHFAYCATDPQEILTDPGTNTIAVLTRHGSHAALARGGRGARHHLVVEKPLCISEEELAEIRETYEKVGSRKADADGRQNAPVARPTLMVGFNRRFAPFVVALKQRLLGIPEPLLLHYRVNAGYIPPEHWTQDAREGGGRLLGEGCHFIDLLIHLAGSPVWRVTAHALPDGGRYCQDNFTVVLEFANGSLATLTYAANGSRSFGKECLEVFGGDLAARLDDFRTLTICSGRKRLTDTARLRQDKGHRAEWQALVAYLHGQGPEPIPFREACHSTEVTLAARRSLQVLHAIEIEEGS